MYIFLNLQNYQITSGFNLKFGHRFSHRALSRSKFNSSNDGKSYYRKLFLLNEQFPTVKLLSIFFPDLTAIQMLNYDRLRQR